MVRRWRRWPPSQRPAARYWGGVDNDGLAAVFKLEGNLIHRMESPFGVGTFSSPYVCGRAVPTRILSNYGHFIIYVRIMQTLYKKGEDIRPPPTIYSESPARHGARQVGNSRPSRAAHAAYAYYITSAAPLQAPDDSFPAGTSATHRSRCRSSRRRSYR